MTAYLFTFRAPAGYTPTPETFDTWAGWQAALGARLKDRGYPGTAAATLGASAAATTLGGYSLIRAGNMQDALALGRGCPMLDHGGTVEIAELAVNEDAFDQWLDKHLGANGGRA
jgi:hypothetical protein